MDNTEATTPAPDLAVSIMQGFLTQVEEQLAKHIENLAEIRKGLARAETIQSRLEGQRDLVKAFLFKYETDSKQSKQIQ